VTNSVPAVGGQRSVTSTPDSGAIAVDLRELLNSSAAVVSAIDVTRSELLAGYCADDVLMLVRQQASLIYETLCHLVTTLPVDVSTSLGALTRSHAQSAAPASTRRI